MKVLIQRVTRASVSVADDMVGQIDRGLLLLVGIEKRDDAKLITKMAAKVSAYRLFPDTDGKMNLNIKEVSGSILAVSQFTLAAETQKGLRPGFSVAASPEQAEPLFDQFVSDLQQNDIPVATGRFGADMQVELINDGPVTFMLQM